MKTSRLLLLSALVFASLSCAKENVQENQHSDGRLVPMTFTVISSDATKTVIGDVANGKYPVLWESKDKIAIFTDNSIDAHEFSLTSSAGTSTASFSGNVADGAAEYYGVYPYNSTDAYSDNEFEVSLSNDQTKTASDIAAGIMVAKADASNNLHFKNVTAFVKFVVPENSGLTYISFHGTNNENLSGTVSFKYDGSTISEISATESHAVSIGDMSTEISAGTYYLAVAPVSLPNGFVLTTADLELKETTKTGTVDPELKAGMILNLGEIGGKAESKDLTVAQLLAKINADEDIKSYNLVGVVSYVETAGNSFSRGTVMIQDNVDAQNTGITIFNSNSSTGFYKSTSVLVGNKVRVSLKNATVQNADFGLQLLNVQKTDALDVISSGNEIVKSIATALTLSSYKGQYVVIENACPKQSGKLNSANTTYKFFSDAEINVFIKSDAWVGKNIVVDASKTGNLLGFVSYFKGTWQIVPTAVSDIAEFENNDPAIFSVKPESLTWAANEYGSEKSEVINISGQYLTTENVSIMLSENSDFTITDVSVSDGGSTATVSVYPNEENLSESEEKTATLTVSLGSFSKEITLRQSKAGISEVLQTWTYEVVQGSPTFKSDASIVVNNATWSIVMGNKIGSPTIDGVPTKYSGIYGWKWGNNKSNYWASYVLSTDYFQDKKVKSVSVKFLNGANVTGTMTANQGEIEIGSSSSTFQKWTELTVNKAVGDGGVLTIAYKALQASFIGKITIQYYD